MRLGLGLVGLRQRRPAGAPAAPVLGTITMSDADYTSGTPESGTFGGDSAGSTLSITGGPNGFSYNSGARTWAFDGTAAAGSGTFAITETLAGATGSPKLTNIAWTVAAGAGGLDPSISAPTLTLATANLTYPPQFDIGLDDTAVVGDTIRLQWDNNVDFGSLTGDATNVIDAGEALSNAATFEGLSSISSGTHRFRARVERGASYSGWSNVVTQGPDDVAPTITSGNPSGTYPEITPISGTLTANETVTWSKSGTNAVAVTLNASTGAWSYTPDFETVPNPTWVFRATDGNGNFSEQTVNLTITDVTEATFSLEKVPEATTAVDPASDFHQTTVTLGAESPDRFILVFAAGYAFGGDVGLRIGSAGATPETRLSTGYTSNILWAWIVPVPTGATVDLFTSPNADERIVEVWVGKGASATPTEITGFSQGWMTDGSRTMTPTTPPGGKTVAVFSTYNTGTASSTWTGATEVSDVDGTISVFTSASRTTAGNAAVSITGHGGNETAGLALSFAP